MPTKALEVAGGLTAAGVVIAALATCVSNPTPDPVTTCLVQYHLVNPDPMPPGEWSSSFTGVTYAAPCKALTAEGEGRWEVLVVGKDDRTIRIYFIGGAAGDRSGLRRSVSVTEGRSTVMIQLEVGGDPSNRGSASSVVGESYVTQIVLSHPLAGRTLTGPNNRGVVEHL